MSSTPTLPGRAPVARVAPGVRGRRVPTWTRPALLVLAVVLGAAARLHSPSTMWLDEALSLGIARRPVPALLDALRRDGSPPAYYLLLHAWTSVLGTSTPAVRALSTLLSLGTLPLVWASARRLGGRSAASAALLLVAVSPFAVRYATETRMYAMVQLLSAALLLAVLRALDRPHTWRLLPVSLLSGVLALTHYWSLFLLAAAAAVLLGLARARRPGAGRTLVALAAGGVLFLPWLPTFLFQVQHTGTPWAPAPHLVDTWYTVVGWAGGGDGPAVVLTLLLAGLALLAVVGHPHPGGVRLGRPVDRPGAALLAVAAGTLALGLGVGIAVHAGYAVRYSSAAFVPGLVLAGLGVRALPPRARTAALALAAVCGLLGSLPQLTSTRRTQARVTALALERSLAPSDVVVYCPDQLGPAVSRLLPPGTDQVVYPTGGSPELVDWVDYASRNAAASPSAFARQVVSRTDGAVWLVSADGYLTFGDQCEALGDALAALRGAGVRLQGQSGSFDEQQAVTRYPARTAG